MNYVTDPYTQARTCIKCDTFLPSHSRLGALPRRTRGGPYQHRQRGSAVVRKVTATITVSAAPGDIVALPPRYDDLPKVGEKSNFGIKIHPSCNSALNRR